MTHLLFAAAVLSASLAAEPAKAPGSASSPPVKEKSPPASAASKGTSPAPLLGEDSTQSGKVAGPPASPEALADARNALMMPCSPEMADGKVVAIEVLDGTKVNALRAAENSKKNKADPAQRFVRVEYLAPLGKGTSLRQISTRHMLTTEQAQALVGEKLCVIID